MLRKIITYFLILAVVLPVLASAVPFGAKISYAQENGDGTTRTTTTKKGDTTTTVTEKTSNDQQLNDPCGWFMGLGSKGTMWECVSYTIMNLLYDWVLNAAIFIAGLAGELFNTSIQFSLTGKVFDADENTMIKDGWTLVRDLLNLIFIFILLFAAISTILQYGNMDIKKILPSLIVVALLVNFSMLITKMVIDASHIFAWEFYNQIDVKNEEGLGDGETFANMKGSIGVYGDFEKKNLANVFIAGFNPQELLTGSDKDDSKSQWKQVLDDAISKGGAYTNTWWQMGLILLLESALAIFAAFILLAGAIMFVVRVVVLWLVMIFSPIAFLGIILPSMGKYSKMWWGYLIGQSFFAPAFLFMFMLVTKFINSDFINSIFETSSNSDLKIVLGLDGGKIVLTFFHFFVVGGLMMACLIVARQLGGKTAEFGISWAHKGKDLALGGANKLAWKPTRLGLRYTGGAAGDSSWWAKSIGRIPGGGMLGRKLGAMKKADEDKLRKAAEKYERGLSEAGSASLKREMASKSFVKRFLYAGPEGAFKPGMEGYEAGRNKREEEKKKKAHKKIQKEKEEADYKVVIQYLGEQAGIRKEDIEKVLRDNNDILIPEMENKINEGIQKNVDENKKKLIGVTIEIKKLEAHMAKNPENKTIQKDLIQKIVEKEKISDSIDGIKNNKERKNQLDQNRINREQTETLETAVKSAGSDKEKSDDKSKNK